MSLPFDIISAVLCDDVRKEEGGKFILIGTYVGSVLVVDFPTKINLHLWVEICPKETGVFQGRLQVVKDDNAVLLRGELQSTISQIEGSVIHLARMPLEFQASGRVRFQMKFSDEDEWSTIREIIVNKMPEVNRPSAS